MKKHRTTTDIATLPRRMVVATLLGVFLEYFDYTLYGFSAPYIEHYFFPAKQPAMALILVWGIFAVSFIVRPIGAVLFGHFADRIGRRRILTFNILIMSLATIGIGILPGYRLVGAAAPLLLLVCRIVQGLSVSTEYSGCSTYLMEFKRVRRGLISGVITSASGFGIFGASLLVLLFNVIPTEHLLLAGWRWPFILAGVGVGLLGYYLRRGLVESAAFATARQQHKLTRFPLWHMLKTAPLAVTRGVIVSAYAGVAIIVLEIYLPSYLQLHFGIARTTALKLSTYLALAEAVCAILWGAFSDKIGQRKTIAISGVLMLVGIFPVLLLFRQPYPLLWFGLATVLAVIVAAADGPMAAFLTASFPTEIRYTSVSISYSLGAAVIGGLSPGILTVLQHKLPTVHMLMWYLLASAVIVLVTLFVFRPKSRPLTPTSDKTQAH